MKFWCPRRLSVLVMSDAVSIVAMVALRRQLPSKQGWQGATIARR